MKTLEFVALFIWLGIQTPFAVIGLFVLLVDREPLLDA